MKKLSFLLILVFNYMLIGIDDCQAQALVRYAKQGHLSKVQELLNKDKGADTTTLNDALWEAAGKGYIDIMKLLIEKGANVNSIFKINFFNKDTVSVIGHATRQGQFESIKLLLEHGANPNAGTYATPLKYAFLYYFDWTTTKDINKLIETLKLLLDNGANPDKGNAILWAIKMPSIDIINLLIEHGADLNNSPYIYWALTYAASEGPNSSPAIGNMMYQNYIETARYLYRLGAKFPEDKAMLLFGDHVFIHHTIVRPDSVVNKDIFTGPLIIPGNYSIELDYRATTPPNSAIHEDKFSVTPVKVDFDAKLGCAYLICAEASGGYGSMRVEEIDFNSNENEVIIKIN